jgi:formylmethanofuran dehydrogenase subunit B
MPKISDATEYKDIVCPFCSLHCDDLKLDIIDNKIFVKSDINESCKDKFERNNSTSVNTVSPKINSKSESFDIVVKRSKKLISESEETLIFNSSSDVNIARELIISTSKINGIFDHINSETFLKNIDIYQRKGFMSTSLSEVKNKSDVIVLFSDNILKNYPRLVERVLAPDNSFSVKANKKKIYIIGNIFNELLQKINNSKYLTICWATSELIKNVNCYNTISSISEYVVSINEKSRAACLPLAGNDGDVSNIQTTGWLTGFPSRIKFTGNYFEYDRDLYHGNNLVESNNIDLVIYVNGISNRKLILNKRNKNIIIGHPSTKYNIQPDVFIPCGIPGIDYKGLIFRTDNVVTLPLVDIKIPTYRSAQEILRRILN